MDGADKETRSDSSRNDGVGEQAAGAGSRVGRVLSRIVSAPASDPEPPPDGGYDAWMAVLSAHFIFMDTWGFVNSFGVFQTYYVEHLGRPPSEVSWIGSSQVFLLFFVGALSGRLTDAGYFRHLLLGGSALVLLGVLAASWCARYWQALLAHGVCVGLGFGLVFCPSLAALSAYFDRRRALAVGLAAAGSASGGLVFPTVVRQLLPRVGFPWAMRALALVQLATLSVGLVFLRPRVPPRPPSRIVDLSAFRELEYTFYTAGGFFVSLSLSLCLASLQLNAAETRQSFMGVYFAFYYLASYSRDELGFSYTESLNLLLVLNGVGLVGRLGPNLLADSVGTMTVFAPMALLSGVLMYCWAAVASPAGLYAWTVLFGVAGNAVQALFPAGLSALTTDPAKQGSRIGMVFSVVSLAVLTGNPIAGAIVSAAGGRYLGAQAFAGSCLVLGAFFLALARVVKTRKMGRGWFVKV
ncbi:major facilitator superfamily transporter [Colletotrichum falcatum]|nr:major facilitator superfamily transporter [Colletotrichum falcatum]